MHTWSRAGNLRHVALTTDSKTRRRGGSVFYRHIKFPICLVFAGQPSPAQQMHCHPETRPHQNSRCGFFTHNLPSHVQNYVSTNSIEAARKTLGGLRNGYHGRSHQRLSNLIALLENLLEDEISHGG